MSFIFPEIDPKGRLEYSVVYSDRSVNHMAAVFGEAMRKLSTAFRQVYNAAELIIIPGGGTFAMEAVARQFAQGQECLVLRTGWFSYRWTQILEQSNIAASHRVLKAKRLQPATEAPFVPVDVNEAVATILAAKPQIVVAPHVETSSGMILPDSYLQTIGAAVQKVGGLFILDGVASGTVWVDMAALNIDILLTAPQKGWSSSPGAGLILLGQRALVRLAETQSSSFALDLRKWQQIMQAYDNGGHAYHATLPTDTLMLLAKTVHEAEGLGFAWLTARQWELGTRVRGLLSDKGFASVAGPGFEAPGVVVCFCSDDELKKGTKLSAEGLQAAAGVPLMCDEGPDFSTFRLGLFGLDKLTHTDRTVDLLAKALGQSGY